MRAALAVLVVLLVLASVTTLAQDEDVHSQGQQIDMTPVVPSQTTEDNAINTVGIQATSPKMALVEWAANLPHLPDHPHPGRHPTHGLAATRCPFEVWRKR